MPKRMIKEQKTSIQRKRESNGEIDVNREVECIREGRKMLGLGEISSRRGTYMKVRRLNNYQENNEEAMKKRGLFQNFSWYCGLR